MGQHRTQFHFEMIRSELEEIVGPHFVSVDETDKLVYSTDWSWMPQMWLDRGERLATPDYIVHPGSAEEISEIMELANKYRIPVVPWGGGSGTQGGALPLYGGILLDTKRMDKIDRDRRVSLTVTAQAGINGEQLEWALHDKGLFLPHYAARRTAPRLAATWRPAAPARSAPSTARPRTWCCRCRSCCRPARSSARRPSRSTPPGPDWPRLFLGAEGTFGVITEATMQVDYLPEARLMRAHLFEDLSKALRPAGA